MQGYLLRQKPRIAEMITANLEVSKIELRDAANRVMHILQIRMFFDVSDFFRPCKRIVKSHGCEMEVKSYEAVPLSELSWEQRMCIDQVTIKTINGKDEWWYKLPNRDKTIDLFLKYYKRMFPERDNSEPDYKETAEIIREQGGLPVIAPMDGKPPKDPIEAM
jgi:hypothetical protein